jgi:hypothetical protein
VVQHLSSKCKALDSRPNLTKRKKRRKTERKKERRNSDTKIRYHKFHILHIAKFSSHYILFLYISLVIWCPNHRLKRCN